MGGYSSTHQKVQQCREYFPKHLEKHNAYNQPSQKAVVYTGNNHFLKMFRKLNEMRKSGTLTDVVIHCSKQDFQCHSIILAVRSTFFQDFFTKASKDDSSEFITFHENKINLDVLESLLEYIYVGSISIPKDRLEEYLEGAKMWNLNCIIAAQVYTDEDVLSPNVEIKQLDFESTIASKLKEYLFTGEDKLGCCSPSWNITITTADKEKIMCHKELLASFSEYFQAMFGSSSFCESYQEDVFLRDMDHSTLCCIITYIYTSQINFDYNILISILATRWMLVDEDLLTAAEHRLVNMITYENCIDMYIVSVANSFPLLERESSVPVFDGLQHVMQTVGFKQLSLDSLCEYLSSDKLSVLNEKMVFEAVLSWSKKHSPENTCHAFASCVRFSLLSYDDLTYCIDMLSSLEQSCYSALLSELLEAKHRINHSPAVVDFQSAGIQLRDCFKKVHLTVIACKPGGIYSSLVVLRVKSESRGLNYGGQTTGQNFCFEYFCKFDTEFGSFRNFCVAAFNNQLYITGGLYKLVHLGLYNPSRPCPTTLIFNPRVPHKWSQGGDLQVARYMHHMVLVGGSLYVLGGKNRSHEFECQVEKLCENKWIKETVLPHAEENMVCCAWEALIFVLAKAPGSSLVLRRYSTTRRHWLPALVLSTPEPVLGSYYAQLWDLIVIKEKIYLFEKSGRDYKMVSVFDPVTERWQPHIQDDAPLSHFEPFLQDDVTLVALGDFSLKSIPFGPYKSTPPIYGTCLWTPTENSQTIRNLYRYKPSAQKCRHATKLKSIPNRYSTCPVYVYIAPNS